MEISKLVNGWINACTLSCDENVNDNCLTVRQWWNSWAYGINQLVSQCLIQASLEEEFYFQRNISNKISMVQLRDVRCTVDCKHENTQCWWLQVVSACMTIW